MPRNATQLPHARTRTTSRQYIRRGLILCAVGFLGAGVAIYQFSALLKQPGDPLFMVTALASNSVFAAGVCSLLFGLVRRGEGPA